MNKTAIISVLGVGLIVVAGYFFFTNSRSNSSQSINGNQTRGQNRFGANQQTTPDTSAEELTEEEQLLAGSNSFYYTFTQSAYEKALASDKLVFLEFYANWCPICRAEQEDIVAGFNQLEQDDVIGFRVNFKDDETDSYENELARDLNVTYQHTKFLYKDGQQVLRDGNQWDLDDFLSNIASAAQ